MIVTSMSTILMGRVVTTRATGKLTVSWGQNVRLGGSSRQLHVRGFTKGRFASVIGPGCVRLRPWLSVFSLFRGPSRTHVNGSQASPKMVAITSFFRVVLRLYQKGTRMLD